MNHNFSSSIHNGVSNTITNKNTNEPHMRIRDIWYKIINSSTNTQVLIKLLTNSYRDYTNTIHKYPDVSIVE
jgi:hypothetical protein